MSATGIVLLVMLAMSALLIFYVIWLYNRLVQLRNQFKNAFAQIAVQLKRRYDLIPNLVETAKGYLKHEKEVLEAVITARNQAASAEKKASANPADQAAIAGLMGAEGALSGTLGRLFALVEAYPELKADNTMAQLSEELTSTENRIAFARQAFNDAVMFYNTAREVFPSNIVSGFFNFSPATLLELESTEEAAAPQVSFT
ncbi:LemA family protein [Trichloromonas sp.]|uniref:LemA family protein n=1 Tax=Trichloromonas sp. TaxID=3069249 RepID=UPI003D81A2CF